MADDIGSVVSGGGTPTDNSITNQILSDVPTATFKGRTTASTGDPEDLTVAQAKTLLNLTGTNSGDQTITLTGDVTGSGTGSFAATIPSNTITNDKAVDMAQSTIKGRASGAGTGDPQDLTAAQMREIIQDTDNTSGYLEDFHVGSGGGSYVTASTGTGSSFAATNSGIDYNRPGIVSAATGTTTTGRGSGISAGFKLGQAAITYRADVFLVNLSTVTEEFIADVGFGNVAATSTLPTEGIYFKYDRLTSVNWIAVCSNDTGGTTTTDTGVAAAASTWVNLKWVLNSANTEILYYINNSLVATHNTSANIPTGGPTVTPYIRIVKSAGTTSRAFNVDYTNWLATFTTPRG